jgi:hypothetical protein
MHKSPFFVVENFLSPLMCEDIVDRLNHTLPNFDKNGIPEKTIKFNRLTEVRLLPLFEEITPTLESYFKYNHKGISSLTFEWYASGFKGDIPRCENSQYINRTWRRINNNDFVGFIPLNDHNDRYPFDPAFEVSGGKINFPNHRFAFTPKRGSLIVCPGNQNFLNYVGEVKAGNLNLIKFYITSEKPYIYDPKNFPGDYKTWFK